jgi:L-amino acid N-acyltransferase YncA
VRHDERVDGEVRVRNAGAPDGAAGAASYAPFVAGTAITFETEAPTATEMAARIGNAGTAQPRPE